MAEHVDIEFTKPELSEWECDVFGLKGQIRVRPTVKQVPNWFWRLMQYLIFGNEWRKVGK